VRPKNDSNNQERGAAVAERPPIAPSPHLPITFRLGNVGREGYGRAHTPVEHLVVTHPINVLGFYATI